MVLTNQLIYLVNVKTMRKIFSNYVCFSKSPKFNRARKIHGQKFPSITKIHISSLNDVKSRLTLTTTKSCTHFQSPSKLNPRNRMILSPKAFAFVNPLRLSFLVIFEGRRPNSKFSGHIIVRVCVHML